MSGKLDLDKQLEQDTMDGVDDDEWVRIFALPIECKFRRGAVSNQWFDTDE